MALCRLVAWSPGRLVAWSPGRQSSRSAMLIRSASPAAKAYKNALAE